MSEKEKQQVSKTKRNWWLILLGGVAGGLIVANIVASNTLATTGKKLQVLNQEAYELEEANRALERQLSEKQSLVYIEKKVEEMGFGELDKTISLVSPEPLAHVSLQQ